MPLTSFRICSLSLGAVLVGACSSPTPATNLHDVTLNLSSDGDGHLVFCGDDATYRDADARQEEAPPENGALDDDECRELPNPDDCARAEIEINTETGDTGCYRCYDADGEELASDCEDPPLVCLIIEAPEPDCVVCAVQDGAVIFSSCIPSDPGTCELTADGCEQCYGPDGTLLSSSCPPDCAAVACPDVACGPESVADIAPGECCPRCLPIPNCENVECPLMELIACPDGQLPTLDPFDCCGLRCEPADCSSFAGAEGDSATGAPEGCPPGYVWVVEAPICGQCVPEREQRFCLSDEECLADEICTHLEGECLSPPDCAFQACPDVCYGVCRPADVTCDATGTDFTAPGECEGEWLSTVDYYGCPITYCQCFDGSISLDGLCRDACANVDCFAAPPECPDGTMLDFTYNCCGECIPVGCGSSCDAYYSDPTVTWASQSAEECMVIDFACSDTEELFANECGCGCIDRSGGGTSGGSGGEDGSGSDPSTGGGMVCPEIACAPGYHQAPDPAGCCYICVADGCASDDDCLPGQQCQSAPGCLGGPTGEGCPKLCVSASCIDPAGVDPFTAETVTSTSADGGATSATPDRCDEDGLTLIEIICLDDGTPWEARIACQNGCLEGACTLSDPSGG